VKHAFAFSWLCILILCNAGVVASDLSNVVKVDVGYVVGSGTTIRAYKGIPFAAPPVGELRWRAPQPVKPWNTIRSAKSFSLSCPQVPGAVAKSRTGEDCLTVNVWTPTTGDSRKLPVLVSIYGGGFQTGASEPSIYDGERLASQGIVVVSFNYRVGVFGFLAHPELSKESAEGISGNYALLDMLAALNWVQRNVGAFGGDAGNVTIWGESAGGSAVGLLLVMPQAAGLFHKAIASSPWSMGHPISRLRESPAGHVSAEQFGAQLGTLATLRAKSADELVELTRSSANAALTIDPHARGATYRPVIDGVILPDDPAALFQQGRFHRVALIAGTTADEGVFFVPRLATFDQANAWLRDQFGEQRATQLKRLYGMEDHAQAMASVANITGDALCLMGARSILRAATKHNAHVYQYEFTRVSGVARRMKFNAHHGADIGYMFGTLPDSLLAIISPALAPLLGDYSDIDERLSQAIMGAIVQFSKTGNPNADHLPHWPAFGKDESYLDYGDTVAVKRSLHTDKLDLLDAIFAEKRRR
jgi:para-nitrobenzyl esterase